MSLCLSSPNPGKPELTVKWPPACANLKNKVAKLEAQTKMENKPANMYEIFEPGSMIPQAVSSLLI